MQKSTVGIILFESLVLNGKCFSGQLLAELVEAGGHVWNGPKKTEVHDCGSEKGGVPLGTHLFFLTPCFPVSQNICQRLEYKLDPHQVT